MKGYILYLSDFKAFKNDYVSSTLSASLLKFPVKN
jgi:hypothetical protein